MRQTAARMAVLQAHLEDMATKIPIQKIRNEVELAVDHLQLAGDALMEAIKRNEEHHHVGN